MSALNLESLDKKVNRDIFFTGSDFVDCIAGLAIVGACCNNACLNC